MPLLPQTNHAGADQLTMLVGLLKALDVGLAPHLALIQGDLTANDLGAVACRGV